MGDSLNGDILRTWKAAAHSSHIRVPGDFLFSEGPDGLTMTFRSEEGMGLGGSPRNMQDDSGAFEGWALALYVHYLNRGGTVSLDIPEDAPPDAEDLYRKFDHYSRFLYRVLRFSQYPWFRLSSRLRERVGAFDAFLKSYDFTNHVPSGSAVGRKQGESHVEGRFADAASREGAWLLQELGAGEIYRQLPVGLYRGRDPVFPGGRAAIDLWTLSDGVVTVLELKTGGNKGVGVLSELFFYTNYVYDMFVEKGNRFHPDAGGGDRGYQALQSASGVRGCLLLDKASRHPLITDSILEELNRGAITYGCLEYELTAAPQ